MSARHRATCPACGLSAHRFQRFEIVFAAAFNAVFRTLERVATIGA